ncbi:MAG: hypothetical protein ACFE9S_09650 [Candidatus Hermodarchaeota archaeon]
MKKSNWYKLGLSTGSLIGFMSVFILYFLNLDIIIQAYNDIQGMELVVIILLVRILILFGSSMYMFFKWFKQEQQFLSDIPFLFGIFFLLLTFGKMIDLFFDFTYLYFPEPLNLLVIKIRYFIIIFTVLSLIYLSTTMILFSLSLRDKFQNLRDETSRNKSSLIIVIIVVVIESTAVIIVSDTPSISVLLPAVVIPSLLVIVWLFAFSHRNKRLSQVNSFILMIGFAAYLLSQILRPLFQRILGENTSYINVVEIIDLIIFGVIFLGFYMEASYVKNQQ